MPIFWTWVVIAIILTWISAPADTIFTARYTQSVAINENWNFSSAWMLSYAFLIFTLADSMFEASPRIGKLKRKIVLCSILLIVIWFQLFRGNGESLSFVLAAVLMYYVWGKGLLGSARDRVKVNWPMMFLLVFVVFVAAYFVGAMRHSLTRVSSISDLQNVLSDLREAGATHFDKLMAGTWSAALLTPLSVAGDYINGSLSLKYGQTYLDLLGSIMPGFLADWIGYTLADRCSARSCMGDDLWDKWYACYCCTVHEFQNGGRFYDSGSMELCLCENGASFDQAPYGFKFGFVGHYRHGHTSLVVVRRKEHHECADYVANIVHSL